MRAVVVRGGPAERGRQLGTQLRDEIRAFVAEGVGHTTALRATPIERAQLAALVAPYARVTRRHLPDLAEEIDGVADGAGIAREEAWLLQYRRELTRPLPAGCTTFARAGPSPLLAQTIDLAGDVGSAFHLVHVRPTDGPAIVGASLVGLLGYVGMNAAGVCVGINMVLSDDWRIGVSPYLLVRALLRCTGLADATRLLEKVPRSSSRCITVLDRDEVVTFELTATTSRRIGGDTLTHTNHFLHPELRACDVASAVDRMESRRRLAQLRRACEPAPRGVADVASLLQRHPFQKASPRGLPVGVETIATVVMDPKTGTLLARRRGDVEWSRVGIDGAAEGIARAL